MSAPAVYDATVSSERSPIDDRQVDRLRVLAETAHAFAEATPDIGRLLDIVAERCAAIIGDGCYIRLLAEDGVQLVAVATRHPDRETERYLRSTTDGVPLEIGEGISGRVVLTGEPVLLPEVSFEQYRKLTKPEFAARFEKLGISSMVVVRLAARGESLGFVALVRNGVGRPAYTTQDLHLLQDLADRAAMAIDNAQILESLERRVEERTHDLEIANRDARQANKELEAFSYSVSHDLRAPLRAIDGFSRMLEEDHGAALDDDAVRLIAIIRRNTARMGQLIEDLLRFARLGRQALESETVSMDALVRGVIDNTKAIESNRSLDIRLAALPPVTGDRNLLHQVWVNLVGNAVKYTRPRPVAVIEIEGAVDDDEIRYTVKDNGVGFDEQYKDKLFGVFQRLHGPAEFEGTGVGLALVQRIVSRHGGRVWAFGELDRGATFGFALPRETRT
jgi:signal transduction histidine kinase